jgi:NADH:ubiquinone oxidoreductase subunit 2 (subunit N)|eukprot:NODE_48_length_27236_cov_0.507573.p12 type:complete len:101 gc:universal NODE_48_length_27236_cov_0.507573:6885-7187(+)
MALIVVLIIIQQVNAIYIQDLKINNFSTAILIINLLSLAGFPPLLGFVGKFIILKGVIGQAFLICLIAMIISVFSFFIYFNVIGLIQIDKTHYITSLSDA